MAAHNAATAARGTTMGARAAKKLQMEAQRQVVLQRYRKIEVARAALGALGHPAYSFRRGSSAVE
jgi:hypothetical protein